jgi:hypothetical protein
MLAKILLFYLIVLNFECYTMFFFFEKTKLAHPNWNIMHIYICINIKQSDY